jgi:hypothetical protein
LVKEAKQIYHNTEAAEDLQIVDVPYAEDSTW